MWVQLYGRSGFPGSVQACEQFPESMWIEPAYGYAAVGYKITIIFSTLLKDTVFCARKKNAKKNIPKGRFEKKIQKAISKK